MNFKEYLEESKDEFDNKYIMQKLADKDINSKIENNIVYVDKSEIQNTKKILKALGSKLQVKEM